MTQHRTFMKSVITPYLISVALSCFTYSLHAKVCTSVLAKDCTVEAAAVMADQTLKDAKGRIIGFLVDSGDQIKLKSPKYEFLGYYSKNSNKTYDSRGGFVGQGNLLLTLLR